MKLFNHSSLLLALVLVTRTYSRLNIPNDVNVPSVQDDLAHEDLAPREDIFDQAVERGKAFQAQFSSNQFSAPITGGTVADSERQGWQISSISSPLGEIPDDTLRVVLQDLVGPLRNQYYGWRAIIAHDREQTSYRNIYGPKDGVIVALYNFNNGWSVPVTNWSEISWRIWAKICESESIDPKTLKYIVRHKIANVQTLDIIRQVYRTRFRNKVLGERIILYPSGRTLQGFQAVLGSPNGRGVAWMLLNKRNILGKMIAKITVEWVEKDAWDMWFELQQIAVAPPSMVIE